MVGYVRLLLAYLVLLSHINLRPFGLNPGVFAVVIFYILAGHVVTHLWDDILPRGPGLLGRFLRDRFLRIYPLYLAVCLLTLAFLLVTGYGQPDFTLGKMVNNALIVPLNYFMWLDSEILQQPAWCLVPPAWSLGAELQAYLLMFVIFVVRPLKYLFTLGSVGVFLLASFGVLDPNYFGYRLLPGVFFLFMVGHCLSRVHTHRASRFDTSFPPLLWLLIVVAGALLWARGGLRLGYVSEIFSGLLTGIPLVYLLRTVSLRLPGGTLCGALSYGLFLSHFLVIWVLDSIGLAATLTGTAGLTYVAAVTAGSLVLAGGGVFCIEAPLNSYRKVLSAKKIVG